MSLVKFVISIISVISSKKGKYFSGRYFKEGRYFRGSLLSRFVINLWNYIATCRYVQNFTVTNSCRSLKKTRFLFAFQFAKWSSSNKFEWFTNSPHKHNEKCMCTMFRLRGGGGGGLFRNVLYGETPLRGPTPHPFIYHFRQKRYPFVYLLLRNGSPFKYVGF